MLLEKTLFFRKVATPWHDTDVACAIIITTLIFISVFAVVGILVSLENQNFEQHAWFPGLLVFLSLSLAIKIFLRIKKRASSESDL